MGYFNAICFKYDFINNTVINQKFHIIKFEILSYLGQCRVKQCIYVCTFCQVFSPQLETVSNHISIAHSQSLPVGTKPEDFVSKLQSLEGK